MDIKVTGAAELKQVFARLGDNAKKAVPIWQNSIGEHGQLTMRRQLPSRFTMRGTRAGFEAAVIFAKATSQKPAELKVGSDSATTRTGRLGRTLARHEVEQSRSATSGQGFFIPALGIRTATKNPPRNLYPAAIMANPVRVTKTKGRKGAKIVVAQGATYTVTDKGIFRLSHSVGLTQEKARPIWWFVRRVSTPQRLQMHATVQDVVDRFAVGYGVEAVNRVLGDL